MYFKQSDLNHEYREKLLRHFSVLIRLEQGMDVPVNEVMLAVTFINGYTSMLLQTAVDAEDDT